VSSRGTRRVPYDRFHTGYKQIGLGADGLTDAIITAAEAALEREIAPIDDIRSTARYRLRVARALLREALRL
jgi:xanthine dehydrogenase iron-sulfur cluster and FAD-binding subunit A